MRISRQVLSGSEYAFVLCVSNVFASLWRNVTLDKAKINHVDDVCFFTHADHYVFRLHVSVDVALAMHELKPVYYLNTD